MKLDYLSAVLRFYPLIIGAVHAVEAIAGAKRGKDKQDAAIMAIRASVTAIEGAAGRDLINDTDVEQAVRGVIDAYVALHNIIAAKAAATHP